MEMSLQTIYFIVGAVGFFLAAVFAISAVAYFFRANIRGVLADLSGKTRSAELAEFSMPKRGRGSKKSVLTGNNEWTGGISHGDLAARSGSDAITEDPAASGSESGKSSDWSYSDATEEAAEPESDIVETAVGAENELQREDGSEPVSMSASQPPATVQGAPAHEAAFSAWSDGGYGQFRLVRQIISVHSTSVIDEAGNEVALGAVAGGDQ